MMTGGKLMKMAKKWQKDGSRGSCCNERRTANKGHFVVYTADENRFVIPLWYLNTSIFKELLRMSADEFGLPTDGPITLLCDSTIMSYLINVFERGLTEELEMALFVSIASNRYSLCSFDHGGNKNGATQSLVYGF